MAKMKIPALMVAGIKGGTCKSTCAINQAYEAMRRGLRVGFVDLDFDSPKLGEMLDFDGYMGQNRETSMIIPVMKDGIKFVSTSLLSKDRDEIFVSSQEGNHAWTALFALMRNVEWGDIDLLILDAPAGVGEAFLASMDAIGRTNLLGIVVSMMPGNRSDLLRLFDLCTTYDLKILGVIENMNSAVSRCCHAPVVCEDCKKPFVPYMPLDEASSIRATCTKNDLVYFGAIPLIEGFSKDSANRKPFYPSQFMSPIARAIDLVVTLQRLMKTRNELIKAGKVGTKDEINAQYNVEAFAAIVERIEKKVRT